MVIHISVQHLVMLSQYIHKGRLLYGVCVCSKGVWQFPDFHCVCPVTKQRPTNSDFQGMKEIQFRRVLALSAKLDAAMEIADLRKIDS